MVDARGGGIRLHGSWARHTLDAGWCAARDGLRWRCHHLISNPIRFLFVEIVWRTDTKLCLQAKCFSLAALITLAATGARALESQRRWGGAIRFPLVNLIGLAVMQLGLKPMRSQPAPSGAIAYSSLQLDDRMRGDGMAWPTALTGSETMGLVVHLEGYGTEFKERSRRLYALRTRVEAGR